MENQLTPEQVEMLKQMSEGAVNPENIVGNLVEFVVGLDGNDTFSVASTSPVATERLLEALAIIEVNLLMTMHDHAEKEKEGTGRSALSALYYTKREFLTELFERCGIENPRQITELRLTDIYTPEEMAEMVVSQEN